MTQQRMNPGAFTWNDTVYFAGGNVCKDAACTKGKDIASVEYYDEYAKMFKVSPESLPAARSGLQCVSLDTAVVCGSPPDYFVWHGPGEFTAPHAVTTQIHTFTNLCILSISHTRGCHVYNVPIGTKWESTKQSIYRIEQGFTAVAGRWAVFAGGEAQPDDHSKSAGERVDVFDATSNKWSTMGLTAARKKLACGAADDIVVCAGGFDSSGHGGYCSCTLDTVGTVDVLWTRWVL
jgi:hypothetical protein